MFDKNYYNNVCYLSESFNNFLAVVKKLFVQYCYMVLRYWVLKEPGEIEKERRERDRDSDRDRDRYR